MRGFIHSAGLGHLHIPDPVFEARAYEALVGLSHMVHNEPHSTTWPRVRERDLLVKAGPSPEEEPGCWDGAESDYAQE